MIHEQQPVGVIPEANERQAARNLLKTEFVDEQAGSIKVKTFTLYAVLQETQKALAHERSLHVSDKPTGVLMEIEAKNTAVEQQIAMLEAGEDPRKSKRAMIEVIPVYNAYIEEAQESINISTYETYEQVVKGKSYRERKIAETATKLFLQDLREINLQKARQQNATSQ